MTEFKWLRAKVYSYLIDDISENEIAQGTKSHFASWKENLKSWISKLSQT